MEKFLAEDPFVLRHSERSDININDRFETRSLAQEMGVHESELVGAVEVAGLSRRAVRSQLGCC